MVHHFRRRRALVALCNRRLRQNLRRELPQPRIFQRFRSLLQLSVKLLDVCLGVRQIIGQVHFLRSGAPQRLERKLRLVAVHFDARPNLHEIVPVDLACGRLEPVPHAGFNRAGPVTEFHAQVGFSFARVADLFGIDEE